MGAARKLKRMVVAEDADEPAILVRWDLLDAEYLPPDDALAHAISPEQLWPAWWCDCGQHNDGQRWNCTFCGQVREDADTLC